MISSVSDAAISFDCTFSDGIRLDFLGLFADKTETFSNFVVLADDHLNNRRFQGGIDLAIDEIKSLEKRKHFLDYWRDVLQNSYESDFEQFIDNFSRIFIGKPSLNRTPPVNSRLSPDASNLPQIIGLIFENEEKRNDFIEWLRILVPEFKDIEVKRSNIDGSYDFFVYEKGSQKPFPKALISDGTYNILALMAAVYQSNQPQFLCIEEPENGLHPQAIELLVDFFREKCETEGHYIWLNTHSQTLVCCLEIDEIILVNKVDGATRAKQLTREDEINIKTDEAWLSNALGGGVLWSK
jgi:predicted ATPase